jgi:hypothetical protein
MTILDLRDDGEDTLRGHLANAVQILRSRGGFTLEERDLMALQRRLEKALALLDAPAPALAPIGLDQEMAVLADEGTA